MIPAATSDRVESVRSFNRFYTDVLGILREGLVHTPYSLTEARLLWEIAQCGTAEVGQLRKSMNIDAGYLSRILNRFEGDGLVTRERSPEDGRRIVISLTKAGQEAFDLVNGRSGRQIAELLGTLTEEQQRKLLHAMQTIRNILEQTTPPEAYILRPLRPGDLGWVVHRHGVVYSQEYGFDQTFEALVAKIAGEFILQHDPDREQAWIAEVDGRPAGSIFCAKKDDDTAQLRLLLVEPSARGLGIGSRLVEECVRFARRAGYQSIMLWTNNLLVDARRVYERAGFQLVREEPRRSFGRDMIEQYWLQAL